MNATVRATTSTQAFRLTLREIFVRLPKRLFQWFGTNFGVPVRNAPGGLPKNANAETRIGDS
jgi:hypothetical protein